MKQFSSIFNDVLGPVMNGPSSSHTAASARIGKLFSQMLPGKHKRFIAYFDENGTLAPTYEGQWVNRGLAGGLLGMEPDDPRLVDSLKLAQNDNLEMNFVVCKFPNNHPNTYKLRLENENDEFIEATALSVGGGMIEFIEVDGFKTSIDGGFYETLIFTDSAENKTEMLKKIISSKSIVSFSQKSGENQDKKESLYQIKTESKLDDEFFIKAEAVIKIKKIIQTEVILPVKSQIEPNVPFKNSEELLELAEKNNFSLWEMALWYESERAGLPKEAVYEKMRQLLAKMRKSLEFGLAGTEYEDRILGAQSVYFNDPQVQKRIIKDDAVNRIIQYISALMEVKSSMGVFVAAPTAGSCGCVTGTVIAIADYLKLDEEKTIKAMFAAGIIGVFIAERATFAAEVAGCQAECGSGSGMAAAALSQLMDATARQSCDAASMALQNVFGMTCDPVAMRVEAPCLGKNVMSGMNAFSCANMVLAGFDAVIPLDETIEAFNEVGNILPASICCTGGAGITVTPTAKKIERKLREYNS